MISSDGFSDFYFGEDKGERLTLVAWGNLKEDTLITTEIAPGTPLKEAKLQLRQHAHGTHIPLTDLFYCRREIDGAETRGVEGTDITVVMERKVAGLSIRTRYLAERYPYGGEVYRFIVHCTSTEMDFTGEVAGNGAGYEPASVTDAKGMSMRRLSISSQPGRGSRWRLTSTGKRKNCSPSPRTMNSALCMLLWANRPI